jgi:hypothetical protein
MATTSAFKSTTLVVIYHPVDRDYPADYIRPDDGEEGIIQQAARGVDGSLHFWIGRRKTPRRTDLAPALRFDLVEWK